MARKRLIDVLYNEKTKKVGRFRNIKQAKSYSRMFGSNLKPRRVGKSYIVTSSKRKRISPAFVRYLNRKKRR